MSKLTNLLQGTRLSPDRDEASSGHQPKPGRRADRKSVAGAKRMAFQ